MNRPAAPRRRLLALPAQDGAPVVIDMAIDGDDHAPALVLLPSSLRDSLDCDDVATALAGHGWRVLRPQPRGMAGSHGPMAGLSLHRLARDVLEAADAVGAQRLVLAGHAFGHFVARVAAQAQPQRVRGVALLAAAAREFPPGLAAALDTAADALQPRALRLQALRQAFFAPGHAADAWLQGWYPQWRAHYRAAGSQPPKPTWWPVSPVPLLDLQAAQDPWRPPATRDELRAALGEALVTTALIDDASHALLPEQPQAVAEAVHRWARCLPA
ncbi:alpha/beta fold hydrolase [Aquincola tertiaricarbonis]|uniref:alpha/beta fold hydrolase n=1 Tax=Aquincola tertiaricarbonis TaxID=391953 RepID=UPI00069868C6|nr:alpha/beta fold hydrolase [Aquincola tertiaricarbonis]